MKQIYNSIFKSFLKPTTESTNEIKIQNPTHSMHDARLFYGTTQKETVNSTFTNDGRSKVTDTRKAPWNVTKSDTTNYALISANEYRKSVERKMRIEHRGAQTTATRSL